MLWDWVLKDHVVGLMIRIRLISLAEFRTDLG